MASTLRDSPTQNPGHRESDQKIEVTHDDEVALSFCTQKPIVAAADRTSGQIWR